MDQFRSAAESARHVVRTTGAQRLGKTSLRVQADIGGMAGGLARASGVLLAVGVQAWAPSNARARRAPPPPSRSTVCKATETDALPSRVVTIRDSALGQIATLKKQQGLSDDDMVVRMGVRAGGCSGMSYVMDVVASSEVDESDHVETYDAEGFRLVVDPKSLLYLFGMELDWSDELIGGGFQFHNPNADSTCGCGKSFGV